MTFKQLSLTFTLLLGAFVFSFAQDMELPGMDISPMDAAHYPPRAAFRNYYPDQNINQQIKVLYSRPQKKERAIFGDLVPFGREWRLGANEGTEITFFQPVEINHTILKAGTYTILASVFPEEWVIKISSERFIAGTDNRDMSKDLVSAPVPTINLPHSRESLAMGFQKVDENNCNLVIEWDRTRVSLPINLSPPNLAGMDVSPMDLAQYPRMSRFRNFMEDDEKELAANQAKVRVVYSRPQKKGRTVFGELVKYGEPWRLGANETTEITFFEDVMIGDTEVKAGTYGLMAVVNENNWEFVVHNGIPSWGTHGHDDENNVAKVSGPVESMSKAVEGLTMDFEKKDDKTVHLVIAWDKTMARMPIKMK